MSLMYGTVFKSIEDRLAFEKWREQRLWEPKLDPYDHGYATTQGFLYPDSSWIELDGSQWHTIAATEETTEYSLDSVEMFLWNAHARNNWRA